MSTPAAKRRRIDASKTLSKPFRSPFKSPLKNPTPTTTTTPFRKTSILTPKAPNLSAPTTPHLPQRSTGRKTFSSPISSAVLNADPEIAGLLRTQRILEKELKALKEEVDVAEQAAKIEGEAKEREGVDGELVVLIERWRGASRMASEEMFGRVRDRVNRMGGPRAWKEMQKKQSEFQNQWEQDDQNTNDSDDDNDEEKEEKEKRKKEMYTQYDIDIETENEKSQRRKGMGDTGESAGEEDEFTMAMMLRTLNVDLDVIGYDREGQRWTD